jgi:hypothetical protein
MMSSKRIQVVLWLAIASGQQGIAFPHLQRQDSNNTAHVDLSVTTGNPEHLASGVLYGVPDTPDQIPDHWYVAKA